MKIFQILIKSTACSEALLNLKNIESPGYSQTCLM